MDTWTSIGAFAGGILLLILAGDALVKHAAHMAVSYRVPKTVVGAIVIGFGTSLPELFVSVTAALGGSPDIALGNIVGSNIANIGLVMGLGALLATLHVPRSVYRADLPFGILAALFLLAWAGPRAEVSRTTGGILLAAFAGYLLLAVGHTRVHRDALPPTVEAPERRPLLDGLWVLVGLVGITAGARFLVLGAKDIAAMLGVPQRVIGVSAVALGTSLPELAAIIAAARKGETDLAVGNIAGSNLFNLLFVLGLASVIHPIEVAPLMRERDFLVLAAFSVLALPLLASERRIGKRQGLILIAAYAGYIAWTYGSRE